MLYDSEEGRPIRREALPELAASDLRQYVYCPRVIYYRYCLAVRPPPTYKMTEGKLQHERTEALERRRTLRAYGLADGERVFAVHLLSERLGIAGTMDMVILRRHEVIPVEFKHAEARALPPRPDGAEEVATVVGGLAVPLHHKYQLAAYALLAEERWQVPARRCFVYFVAARRAAEVAITPGVRRHTRRLLGEMR
ncbi:MAG: CRISPR-associated protein Cas4 [Chloroflexota bacterium]